MSMEISSGQPNIMLGGGNGDCFGGNGLMFLAFLAMMGGGFSNCGGGWGRGGCNGVPNNVATTDTVNQAMNYSNLQQQNGQIMAEVQRNENATLSFAADKYSELQRDIANNALTLAAVQAQQAQCCCDIKQQISALNLEDEKRFNALSTKMDQSEIQRLRDALAQQSQNIQDLKADIRFQTYNRNGCCSQQMISCCNM